jgi:hypothetical protein
MLLPLVMQIAPSGNQYLLMLMEGGKLRQLDHAKVVFPGTGILTDRKSCNLQFCFKTVPGRSQLRALSFYGLVGSGITEEADVANMANKIIECSYDPELETWNYMRMRFDKETPNAYHVYLKVRE